MSKVDALTMACGEGDAPELALVNEVWDIAVCELWLVSGEGDAPVNERDVHERQLASVDGGEGEFDVRGES